MFIIDTTEANLKQKQKQNKRETSRNSLHKHNLDGRSMGCMNQTQGKILLSTFSDRVKEEDDSQRNIKIKFSTSKKKKHITIGPPNAKYPRSIDQTSNNPGNHDWQFPKTHMFSGHKYTQEKTKRCWWERNVTSGEMKGKHKCKCSLSES